MNPQMAQNPLLYIEWKYIHKMHIIIILTENLKVKMQICTNIKINEHWNVIKKCFFEKSKQQQWKYIYVGTIKTGHYDWYELLLSLIFYVYFVTNDMYAKCHYNEQLLAFFISKQWKGSMKWLILHIIIIRVPKCL